MSGKALNFKGTVLLLDETDESPLLNLMQISKPLDENDFDGLLRLALDENNERKQYLLLALAKTTRLRMSAGARTHLAALFQSSLVRV